jgi:peptide/nickel transport system permease protein
MAILIFSVALSLLPTSGRGGVTHWILPVVVLGFGNTATILRVARSSMLEVMSNDFIRTARGKGLPERRVLFDHAARNGLIPVMSVAGVNFGRMLVAATVVESIFAWPGVGKLLLDSMLNLDYPVLVAYGMVVGILMTLLNMSVDLSYTILDPRVRL